MKFIDLTHAIHPGMPAYPGTRPPEITEPCTIEKNGFREKQLTMYSHTGTHMDSPAHIIPGGTTLDRLPAGHFYGRATVLDVTNLAGPQITPADIRAADSVQDLDFVIFYTGWYHKWGKPGYFSGYPVPSPETAGILAGRGIKGVGMDTISIDPVDSVELANHKIFFANNIVIIENLTNLHELAGKIFTLACFPLKIEDADGAPARAVAIAEWG